MCDPIHELQQMQLPIRYYFKTETLNYWCTVVLKKDQETFDCYGVGRTKEKAQLHAANQMLALLKLLFPSVPLALFSKMAALKCEFTLVEYFRNSPDVMYEVFYLPELKSPIYLYVLPAKKTYCAFSSQVSEHFGVSDIICPIHLLNDPVRYTDWSSGPVILAQEAYLSKRLDYHYKNL